MATVWNGYRDRVSQFIFDYSKKMNGRFTEEPELIEAYRQRLNAVMTFISRVFPYGFRRNATQKTTPHARFEAIAIGSYLALVQRPELADTAIDVTGWLNDGSFSAVTSSDGANVIKKLKNRLYFVRDHLLGA